MPFRPVLDNRLQAWCVMENGVRPQDSCVSLGSSPIAAPLTIPPLFNPVVGGAGECSCWQCAGDGGEGVHLEDVSADASCSADDAVRVCPASGVSPCASGRAGAGVGAGGP